MSLPPIDLFHIGPQKSGTTWVFEALKGHPEVFAAKKDSVHYFDIEHPRGRDWLVKRFPSRPEGDTRKILDATPSYIRSPWAPKRIAQENPQAKIILTLRDPIDRAFSHYWHEKKKGNQRYRFKEVLKNYDLFAAWIETGCYAEAIERYYDWFPKEQVLCQDFGFLKKNSEGFLLELLEFCGLDTSYRPPVLKKRVNAAGSSRDLSSRAAKLVGKLTSWVPGIQKTAFGRWSTGRGEYEEGVPPEVRAKLEIILEPEIQRLEKLLGKTFPEWRRNASRSDAV